MNTLALFQKFVFVQVLLGLVTFCIAAGDPVMLLIAGTATALSWYVVEGPNGTPLPRWIINLGCLAAIIWLFISLDWKNPANTDVIASMGRFTMWVQILMLYTRKKNRDYTLILVLSLMQVLSASVLSISIAFGLLLTAYALVALGTALLFHLKTTSDMVMEATNNAAPEHILVTRPEATVGRSYRLHFRATSIVIAIICVSISAMVFISMPRVENHGRPNRLVSALGPSFVGFSQNIQLNNSSIAFGSQQPVIHLEIKTNDPKLHVESKTWLLRGAALDQYNPALRSWQPSYYKQRFSKVNVLPSNGQSFFEPSPDAATLDSTITVLNKSETTLFTIYPTIRLASEDVRRVLINDLDQTLDLPRQINRSFSYKTQSLVTSQENTAGPPLPENMQNYASGWVVEPERIRELCGNILRDANLKRQPLAETGPDDRQIINALCHYFRRNFEYTLDNKQSDEALDPIVDFLFNHRKGHCELFASGLAAMTRSLGMRTRVITGLVASEYNRVGEYFVVRQSNAHAWVEVYLGKQGWVAFDATPPADLQREHSPRQTWYSAIGELYEHIQFTWLRSVAGFDRATQQQMLSEIIAKIRSAISDRSRFPGRMIQWFKTGYGFKNLDRFTLALGVIIVVFLIIGIWQLFRVFVNRKRRINALKLGNVPAIHRRQMVRSLRFYLLMLDILERHGHIRSPWMTPRQFADHLINEQSDRFQSVAALTELFYEIRFGQRQINLQRNSQIEYHLSQLQKNLAR